jgi:hypothetical protein
MALGQLGVALLQLRARRDDLRLRAGQRRELGPMRPGREVGVRLVRGHRLERAVDHHLALQRQPREHERRTRIGFDLASLARAQVGVKGQAALVERLEQDGAGARCPLGVRRGQDHRVGLWHPGPHRVLQPPRQLLQPGGGKIGLVEAPRTVGAAHPGYDVSGTLHLSRAG